MATHTIIQEKVNLKAGDSVTVEINGIQFSVNAEGINSNGKVPLLKLNVEASTDTSIVGTMEVWTKAK